LVRRILAMVFFVRPTKRQRHRLLYIYTRLASAKT
jgi:hypothetical protein